MFNQSWQSIRSTLLRYSKPNSMAFIAEQLHPGYFRPKMDHLVCFLPGTIALSIMELRSANKELLHPDDEKVARQLMETCIAMYRKYETGLAPEIVYFNELDNPSQEQQEDLILHSQDAHYLLRPETVESLFYLYRMTGERRYQDEGWQIFQSLVKYCKTPCGGYSGIKDVRQEVPVFDDVMQSFFLAETLKYLYLLFSNSSLVPLSEWVFNTEGHPFRKM